MSVPSKPTNSIEVFFSYSHKDEVLRDELVKHLSILRRQGMITAWHDRKITAGHEWAGAIDEHLNTAQVILLLISADFLASDYCYDLELRRVMARHDAGEALVIPIILRPVDWKGAPFGKLQALPKDAKPVTRWPDQDEAFENVASGIREAIKKLPTRSTDSQPPSVEPQLPKDKFRTWVIDQLHRGDFVTISEAINAANLGDRILVRPGLYLEGLVIDKPLEIIGDGAPGEVVVQVAGKDVILFQTTRGRVANLTLRQLGGENWYAVDIAQGRLELEDCDITSQSKSCVAIHNGADPHLRRNRIHDSKQNGVFIYENGQGTLEDNDIFGNAYPAVAIKTGSNPMLRRNRIHDNKQNGVLIYENGQGTLENNDIFGNAYPAVAITTGGNPTLWRNRLYDNKQNGVLALENGQGILEDNAIFRNAYTAVEIRTGGNLTLRRNRINNHVYLAIWVYDGGAGTFEDNDLRDNAMGAWFISEDCLPNVKRANNIEE